MSGQVAKTDGRHALKAQPQRVAERADLRACESDHEGAQKEEREKHDRDVTEPRSPDDLANHTQPEHATPPSLPAVSLPLV